MSKVENLVLIINLLQSRRSVKIKAIMEECNISQRTAYRYVRSLGNAGIPLFFDPVSEGYRIADRGGTFSHLSPEESTAVLFALEFLESSLSPYDFHPLLRAKTKLQAHLTKRAPNLVTNKLISVSKIPEESLLRELVVVALVKSARETGRMVRVCYHNDIGTKLTAELISPRLVFDAGWKIRDTSTIKPERSVPARKVVDIEMV